MRRTLKRTKSKKQEGKVRDLKPVKEAKGSGKIEHAVEHHDTAAELIAMFFGQRSTDLAHARPKFPLTEPLGDARHKISIP
jgi:hypothetical protein